MGSPPLVLALTTPPFGAGAGGDDDDADEDAEDAEDEGAVASRLAAVSSC